MSSNPVIFTSILSESRWAHEIDSNFPKEHTVIDMEGLDTRTCIFRVPKTLSETKPEAYAPQRLGLGPYHHLRPEFYRTQKHRLSSVRKFLGPEKLQMFNQVVDALIQCEPVLRACYDQYLDFDIATLARILAVDSLYLLQYFEGSIVSSEMEVLPGDMVMLENQIPVVLLSKARQAIQIRESLTVLFEGFDFFCRDHSPLELNRQDLITKDTTQMHLLHRMYFLIVSNRGINDSPSAEFSTYRMKIRMDDVSQGIQFLADRGVPGASTAGQILSFVEKVPLNRILSLFGKDDEQIPSVEEIEIPTVSAMCQTAKIRFALTPGGIRDVKYDDSGNEKIFYLPSIRLDAISEVILRNLVAYETALVKDGQLSTLELAEYVDLMCGIIDTNKDVDILKKANIIRGELADEEIVRIFNGIRKSTEKGGEKSNIEKAIGSVNESYNNVGSVKVKQFLKKCFSVSWKFISVVIAVCWSCLYLMLSAWCLAVGAGLGEETHFMFKIFFSWINDFGNLKCYYEICSDHFMLVMTVCFPRYHYSLSSY